MDEPRALSDRNLAPESRTAASASERRRSSRRGVSLVECLVLLALLGLGLIAGVQAIQQGLSTAASDEASAIAAMIPVDGSGTDVRPAPPPAPEPPPAEEPQEEEDDGGFWGDALDFAIGLTPIGDVQTLLDPNASVFDKVLSGVSLATSVIPGVGQAVKGVSVAVKAARAVDNASDVVKTADNAGDAARAAERADDAAEPADDLPIGAGARRRNPDEPEACPAGGCPVPGKCFAAGTPVHTAQGLRPIEDVAVGDLVWARDDLTGEDGLRTVRRKFVTPRRAVLSVLFADASGAMESLRVTPEHPFYSQRGWVAAKDLQNADEVMLRSGDWVEMIGGQSLDQLITVYNFNVDDFHTYFVGEAGLWVHNTYVDPAKPGRDIPGRLRGNFPPEHLDKSLQDIERELKSATGDNKRSLEQAKRAFEKAERATKPAKEIVQGSLRREFPGEHLGKSLEDIQAALRTARGAEKKSLQKAKKIIEQAERLLEK